MALLLFFFFSVARGANKGNNNGNNGLGTVGVVGAMQQCFLAHCRSILGTVGVGSAFSVAQERKSTLGLWL